MPDNLLAVNELEETGENWRNPRNFRGEAGFANSMLLKTTG
jgi:hypothetical protein